MGRLPRLFRPAAWPIAAKLSVALLLVALFPMMAVGAYNLRTSMSAVEAIELRNLELLAVSTAQGLDQLLLDTRRQIVAIAGDPRVVAFMSAPTEEREWLLPTLRDALDNVRQAHPDYANIFLMDTTGLTWFDTDPLFIGKNFGFRDYFKAALQGRVYLSSLLVDAVNKRPGLFISAPIHSDEGAVIGVAAIKMWGEALWAIIDEVRLGETGHAFLVDQDGVIIGHPDKSLLYHSLAPLSLETLQAIVAERRFLCDHIESLELVDLAEAIVGAREPGHKRYYAPAMESWQVAGFGPLENHTWVVGVTEPEEQFLVSLHRLRASAGLSALAMALLAVGLALVLARGIVRPIRALIGAARALERGDFDPGSLAEVARVQDDMGQLVRVFRRMAVEVQAREERLKRQVEELRIEIDEAKKARQVAEITETDYFQRLREHAREMRERAKAVS
jgi:C4-dicarboxylate-specific signal transduction histidine kinase